MLSLIGIALLLPDSRSSVPRPPAPAGLLLSVSGLALPAHGLVHAGRVAP
ncbi:hypothetical protein QQY24_29935 [Streptomyces sp. TG1A-8]|nr:hypothetical protein [Streptomyces sp. TG1A-8]MDO0929426.1 hypothetical protein [Streptomyces sp. TG1A-8]